MPMLAGSQTMFTVRPSRTMLVPLKPELILPEVTDGKSWKRGSLWFIDPERQYILRLFYTVREAFTMNTAVCEAERPSQISDLLDPKMERQDVPSVCPLRYGSAAIRRAMLYKQFGERFLRPELFVDQQPMFTRRAAGTAPTGLSAATIRSPSARKHGEIERLRRRECR